MVHYLNRRCQLTGTNTNTGSKYTCMRYIQRFDSGDFTELNLFIKQIRNHSKKIYISNVRDQGSNFNDDIYLIWETLISKEKDNI